jgi:hypothetical protein
MPGKDLPRWRERSPYGLGNAEENATGQCTPNAAKAADNHGLERQNQPNWPGCRIKNCANGEKDAGNRRKDHSDRKRQRIKLAIVDAHQFSGVSIVGHCPKGPPNTRAVEQKLQACNAGESDREKQQGIYADRYTPRKLKADGLDRTLLQAAGICAEALQQTILNDDGNAESHQQRRQQPAGKGEV